MRVCVDASTCSGSYSGTGVYTSGLIHSLESSELIDQLELIGYGTTASRHKLIYWDLHANRPNLQADVSFFPNYFIPHNWSIPSVATIHDLSFITHRHFYSRKMWMFYQRMIRHTIQNATHILTVSETSRRAIHRYLPDNRLPVTVIPPASRLGNQQYPTDSESPYLLYVGNIEPKKNVLAMIEGFAQADLKGLKLRIVGKIHASAGFRRKFFSLIHKYPQVEYLGYVETSKLSELMDRSSGVVNLSHIEGFGLPVLEAIEKNKPVLISDDPALSELGNGEVFETDITDPNHIIRAYRRFTEYIYSGKTVCYSRRAGWEDFRARLSNLLSSINEQYTPAFPVVNCVDNRVQQAILKTIVYSAVFKAPVTVSRLYELLHETSCTYRLFEAELERLLASYPDLIFSDGLHVWLKGANPPADHFRYKVATNQTFLIQNQRIISLLFRLPWIRGLYFSGGSVHGSHLNSPDIDLFIVARNSRVWLVYTLIRLLALITGQRTRICCNYLVDDEAMNISYQRDFYTAFQIAHLQPVDAGDVSPDLRSNNQWIKKIFPNLNIPGYTKPNSKKRSGIGEVFNLLLMHIWSFKWKKQGYENLKGGLLWDAHRIKLHSNDNRPKIYRNYYKLMMWLKTELRSRKSKLRNPSRSFVKLAE